MMQEHIIAIFLPLHFPANSNPLHPVQHPKSSLAAFPKTWFSLLMCDGDDSD